MIVMVGKIIMNFTWASKKPLDEIATLYEANITLNKSATSYFENAYVVLLGLDRDSQAIAIKPAAQHNRKIQLFSCLQQTLLERGFRFNWLGIWQQSVIQIQGFLEREGKGFDY
jgi:hypothetical protein